MKGYIMDAYIEVMLKAMAWAGKMESRQKMAKLNIGIWV